MNFGNFKTRGAKNAGNMQTTHPYYTDIGDIVNASLRLFIMRASAKFPNHQLFPELKDIEWTDVTVANQMYLTQPTDQLIPQRVYSFDSATAPTMANAQWRLLGFIEPEGYDQLSKSTTDLAYPSQWTSREGRIYLHPVPRTTKTTYIKVDGIQDEPDMSIATDTPRTNVRWHPAILDYASSMLLTNLGWDDDAARFLKSCDDKLVTVGGAMIDLRRSLLKKTIRITGAPRYAG